MPFHLRATQSHCSMVFRPREARSQIWEQSYQFKGPGSDWAVCHSHSEARGGEIALDSAQGQEDNRYRGCPGAEEGPVGRTTGVHRLGVFPSSLVGPHPPLKGRLARSGSTDDMARVC